MGIVQKTLGMNVEGIMEFCIEGVTINVEQHGGTESEVNMDLTFGGSGFMLDLTELTKDDDGEMGLELVAHAVGLERLVVDARVFDELDYHGNSINKDIHIPIGWRLESGGSLFLRFDGEKHGFFYGVEVDVTCDQPSGYDFVDFSPKGAAWVPIAGCWPKNFDLDRLGQGSGSVESRCGGKVTMRTLEP